MKTITLCGSMTFYPEMARLKEVLEQSNFVVYTPILEGAGVDYTLLTPEDQQTTKHKFINAHLEKIRKSDAILVTNYDKNGIAGYIGANAFIEMAMAFALGKKIYILKPVPHQDNTVEILGLLPIILNEDLGGLV